MVEEGLKDLDDMLKWRTCLCTGQVTRAVSESEFSRVGDASIIDLLDCRVQFSRLSLLSPVSPRRRGMTTEGKKKSPLQPQEPVLPILCTVQGC